MTENSSANPKKVTPSNTKNEILDAYNELLDQVKREKQPAPQKEASVKKQAEALQEASDQNEEKIIQQVAGLKLTLNTSLDAIEDKLISTYKKLIKTQEAIQIQEERLNELYQINTEADSLAALLAAQKEKRFDFEKYMAEEKASWEKELKDNSISRKEEDENLKKQKKREEEEYNYNLQQKRKMESDQYEEKKARLEKELKEKKEAFELEIKSREQAVSESENELSSLRKEALKFPEILKAEIDKAVKGVSTDLKKEFDYQNVISKKEFESELKLKSQTIENLQGRIKDLEGQLKQASLKIDSAESNVKDITIKAIESNAMIKNAEHARAYSEPSRTVKEN